MSVLPLLLSLLLLFSLPTIHSFPVPTLRSATCPQVLPPPQRPATPRIINGDPTPLDPPHFTLLLSSPINPSTSTRRRCTAGRISLNWALTAAHCRVNTSWTASLPPSTDPITITRVISHPAYLESTDRPFDLALLYLPSPPPLSIPLLINSNPLVPADASFIRVHGYGTTSVSRFLSLRQDTSSSTLNQVDLPVVPFPLCQSAYESVSNVGDLLANRQICAGYLTSGGCDSCTGDSGGPLIQYDSDNNPILVAMVSAGTGCALPEFPGINVKVSPYVEWMTEVGAEFKTSNRAVQVTLGDSLPLEPQTPPAEQSPSAPPVPSPTPSAIARPSQSTTPIPSVSVVGDDGSSSGGGDSDGDGASDEDENENDGGDSSGDNNDGSSDGDGSSDDDESSGGDESGGGDDGNSDGDDGSSDGDDGSSDGDDSSSGDDGSDGDGSSGSDDNSDGDDSSGGDSGDENGDGSGGEDGDEGGAGDESSDNGESNGGAESEDEGTTSGPGGADGGVAPSASPSAMAVGTPGISGAVGPTEQPGETENEGEDGEIAQGMEATPGVNEVVGSSDGEDPVEESSAGGGARLAGIIGGSVAGVVVLVGLVVLVVFWKRR